MQSSHQPSSTEMFLKPMKTAKGEKPLLIIDFVNNIVPKKRKRPWATKEVLNCGDLWAKKAKIRVHFYPTVGGCEHSYFLYLALRGQIIYSIGYSRLSTLHVQNNGIEARYNWKSILMYDNEFRKLQAIYKF